MIWQKNEIYQFKKYIREMKKCGAKCFGMENDVKKFRKIILLGACLVTTLAMVPEKAKASVNVSSEGACVMDVQSGAVLYDKNMNNQEYPASITKIMTTLVALENSSLSEEVVYDEAAYTDWESGASNIGVENGEKISMEESLYAIMLASANEVCNGVGIHVSGSIKEFVNQMNVKAKELGCKNTHFVNPNGLWHKNHYTSPYDMALIGRAAMQREDFRTIAGTRYYEMEKTNKRKKDYPLANHHKMINPANYPQYGYEYCIGGKTGYTFKSRNTLVTFAKKGDVELVCVVMKCDGSVWQNPNAYTDTTKLLNHCFEHYEKVKIQEDTVSEINEQYLFTNFSPFFSTQTSSLHIDENAGIMLPKGVGVEKAEKKIQFYEKAQEKDGKKIIGRLSYTYQGQEVGASNIYYDESNAPTLKDSIDMSKWFDEAVETANKKPFPWKKLCVIIILVGCIIGVSIICVIKIRGYQVRTSSRRRYRRYHRRYNHRDRTFYTKRR